MLLITLAVLIAVADRTTPTRASEVIVAARDIAPGETVRSQDVAREQWPVQIAQNLPSADDVLDRAAAGPLRAGEPVLNHHVAGPDLLQQVAPGSAAVVVSVPRVGDVALARAGDRVDLVAIGRRPRTVADSALILATDQVSDDQTWRLAIALDPRVAVDVVAADALDSLQVVPRAGVADAEPRDAE